MTRIAPRIKIIQTRGMNYVSHIKDKTDAGRAEAHRMYGPDYVLTQQSKPQ